METFSALLPLCKGSPVNSPHKGQWRRALMSSLICAWTSGWANNRDADDLSHPGSRWLWCQCNESGHREPWYRPISLEAIPILLLNWLSVCAGAFLRRRNPVVVLEWTNYRAYTRHSSGVCSVIYHMCRLLIMYPCNQTLEEIHSVKHCVKTCRHSW